MEKVKLTVKQQRAIEALLSEPTVQAAATAAGVSKATVFRWLADSTFSGIYRDLRGQLLESTLTSLQQASSDAVATLKAVMANAMAQPAARVSAARCVLEMSLKAREVLEIEERLKSLESRLTPQQAGRNFR